MKEEQIRPESIFNEYLRLSKLDIEKYFYNQKSEEILCPACGNIGEHSFVKDLFSYKQCPSCLTLYVSPRPEFDCFARYYSDSASSKYWSTTFYRDSLSSMVKP